MWTSLRNKVFFDYQSPTFSLFPLTFIPLLLHHVSIFSNLPFFNNVSQWFTLPSHKPLTVAMEISDYEETQSVHLSMQEGVCKRFPLRTKTVITTALTSFRFVSTKSKNPTLIPAIFGKDTESSSQTPCASRATIVDLVS